MLRSVMPKKDTEQFLLRPSRELLNRLGVLASKHKRDSAQEVAIGILEDYIDMWAEAEQARLDTVKRQHEALRRAIQAEMLKLPIVKTADAAPTAAKSEAQGRKRKQ